MIQSMTGFGKATMQLLQKKITVEIKSLNSKGLDLNVRVPTVYREMELAIRTQLSKALERGKIDFSLYIEGTSDDASSKLNSSIINSYINQLKVLVTDADETELLKMAVRFPDALKMEREALDETEWEHVELVIASAIENIKIFRQDEGQSLEKEFVLRTQKIHDLMLQALSFDSERIETVKSKLRTAIDDLKVTVDENRFEQELIFYLEKYDITEERVRLENHLNYFNETLKGTEANGRKLGFITQEIGREINTMGSKSNHAKMQKLVVMMKDELEKIKEQVLNVL